MDGLLGALSPAMWPAAISLLGVVLTLWSSRRGQDVTSRRDRSSEQAEYRRDLFADVRDLRERLSNEERRADALAKELDLVRRELAAK